MSGRFYKFIKILSCGCFFAVVGPMFRGVFYWVLLMLPETSSVEDWLVGIVVMPFMLLLLIVVAPLAILITYAAACFVYSGTTLQIGY
jgi:hypothetical protein